MIKAIKEKNYKILSGSVLKLVALITMLLDHTTVVVLSQFPAFTSTLFAVGSHRITWYFILRMIGRTAFPLYGFLLVEGCEHTKNKKKYGTSLLAFALISEIPWNLEHSGKIFFHSQSVMVTLFLGFLAIHFYEKHKEDTKRLIISMSVLFLLSIVLLADYGTKGMCFILFMYVMKDKPVFKSIVGTCFFARPWSVVPAFVLMNMYNGERGFIKGKAAKYIFYAIYPAHLLLLYFIKTKYL